MRAPQPTHVEIGDIWIDVSIHETHGVGAEVTDHPVESGSNIVDHIRPLPRTFSLEGLITNHPIELPKSHKGGARVSAAGIEIQAARSQPQRVPPHEVTIEGEPSLGAFGLIPGVQQGAAILGALRVEVRARRQFAAEHNAVDNKRMQSWSATPLHFTQDFDRVGEVHAALVNIVEQSKLVTVVTGLMRYDSVALTDLQFERSAEIGRHALRFSAQARVLRIVQSDVVKLPDPVQPRAKPTKATGNQSPQKTDANTVGAPSQSLAHKAYEAAKESAKRLIGF